MSDINTTPYTLLHLLTDIAYHRADSIVVDQDLNAVHFATHTPNKDLNPDNNTPDTQHEYHHSDETITTTTHYTPEDIIRLHYTYPELITTVISHRPNAPLRNSYLINKLFFQPSFDDALEQVHKNLDPSFVSSIYLSAYTFN